jgi:hypothetical protein
MIPAANIRNFQFTTRYPPDKIVAVYEGSFTATQSSTGFSPHRTHQTISHSFGTSLLLQTTYSLDGGTTWQDQNISIPDLSTPSMPNFQTIAVSAYSTSTQVIVVASNWTTMPKTVTYKVVAMSKT